MWLGYARCRRRGGVLVNCMVGLVALLIATGVEMDACRLFTARHKDQVIADAVVLAAAQKLPYQSQSEAEVTRMASRYRAAYRSDLDVQTAYYPTGSTVPTQVRVVVSEDVPMVFPALMGALRRPARAAAVAGRLIPSEVLQGVVPLGIQYDQDFELPSDGMASSKPIELKLGDGDALPVAGNYYALDLPNGSGASSWSDWLKLGYPRALAVGDRVRTKTGQMLGPTNKAIVDDVDARMNRAAVAPYSDDTWESFHVGNPRIVIVPLVDWGSAKSGDSRVPIKAFAAFWMEDYQKGDGKISGRFVRYARGANGASWDGVSISPNHSIDYDGGLWVVTLTE